MYLAKVNQRVFKRSCCFYFAFRASFGFFSLGIALHPRSQQRRFNKFWQISRETRWKRFVFKKFTRKGRERESDLHFSRGQSKTRLDPAGFHCPELNVGLTTSTWSSTFRWPDIIYDLETRRAFLNLSNRGSRKGSSTRNAGGEKWWEMRISRIPWKGEKRLRLSPREINALWRAPRTGAHASCPSAS